MSFAQFVSVYLATWITFNLWKLAPARARHRTRREFAMPFPIRVGIATIGMAFCFGVNSAAQDIPSTTGSESAASDMPPAISIVITPNAIMGFERPGTWTVSTDTVDPRLLVQMTTLRTQGNAAFSITNPPSLFRLVSRPVASSAAALAGIGQQGALLQVDVLVPCEKNTPPLSGIPPVNLEGSCGLVKEGGLQAFVSSKSLGLRDVSLGEVRLTKYRTGIYNTIGFEIPASVSSALGNAKFSDLVFEFEVGVPDSVAGAYLFDNLRVHSVELDPSPKGEAPPPGYGDSVNLTVIGNQPVTKSFNLNPVQIPSGFHLKQGTAGSTTVDLEAGVDSNTLFTCTYVPDSSDKTGQSYVVKSCTDGYEAGDIVNANLLGLGIEGGETSQRLDAQFALDPLGNLIGARLLPPMPTFWGNPDTCSPAPVAGKVVTNSTSCSSQTAQANQIITNYFNQVNDAKPSPNWVVAPVPETAIRRGDGAPTNQPSATSADAPLDTGNSLTFDKGGDLNPGGSFDAYWKLSGDLTPTAVAGTDENLTHFDAEFTAHGVLFGDDVDVVDAKLTADTDSGETTPTFKAATSSGTLDFFVFGEEIPSGGLTFDPATGFRVDPSLDQEFDLPPIQIWIFNLTLGATVDADLNAQGSAAPSGADLSVTPSASLGAHISGGIDLGIAQGDVDAKVSLATLSTPVTAQAKWVLNTEPEICAATLDGSLNGDLDVSSGGGTVDLDATFGICPFCYTDSYTLLKWGALASKNFNLFNDTIQTQLFGLPGSMCSYPIAVSIVSPTAGASLSSGLPNTLTGSAAPTNPLLASTSTYTWTFTPGANASTATLSPTGANGANPTVTFGAPTSGTTSTWTINLTATTTVRSAGGAILTQTATATPVTVTVTNLTPGVHISQVVNAKGVSAVPQSNGVLNVGNAPGPLTISGVVSGSSGSLNTTFTVVPCNDQTAACSSPGAAATLTTSGAATTTPSATWPLFEGGFYQFTMTTTAGGSTFGTTSVVIFGTDLL
jgi:hypothetical protein